MPLFFQLTANAEKDIILHFISLKRINSLSCLLWIDLNPFFFVKGENYHKIAMNFLTLMREQIFTILRTVFLFNKAKIDSNIKSKAKLKFISAENSVLINSMIAAQRSLITGTKVPCALHCASIITIEHTIVFPFPHLVLFPYQCI